MRVAALIFGILGGLSGLSTAMMGHMFVGLLAFGGLSQGNQDLAKLVLYGLPIASLIGGGLSLSSPGMASLLMLGSAFGWLFLGAQAGSAVNIFTSVSVIMSGLGGVLAAFSLGQPASPSADNLDASVGKIHISKEPYLPDASEAPALAESGQAGPAFNRQKWEAILRYDAEIAAIAKKLEPLGAKWVDRFAADFLVLNDRKYLLEMVRKIIGDARIDAEEKERAESQRRRERIELEEIARQAVAKREDEERAVQQQRQERRKARRAQLWGTPLRSCATVMISFAVIAGCGAGGWWAKLQMDRISKERTVRAQILAMRENFASNLGETHPSALAALRRTLPSVLQSTDWVYNLRDVEEGVTKLDRNGTQYLLGWVCKPHDCADNQFAFLVAADGSRAVSGIKSSTYGSNWYGNPSVSEMNLLSAKMH